MLIEMTHPKGGSYKTVAAGIRFSGVPPKQMTSALAHSARSLEMLSGPGMTVAQIDAPVAQGAVTAMEQT